MSKVRSRTSLDCQHPTKQKHLRLTLCPELQAALNMYGVKLARELGDKGYTVLLIHPGYVKTDMVRA